MYNKNTGDLGDFYTFMKSVLTQKIQKLSRRKYSSIRNTKLC